MGGSPSPPPVPDPSGVSAGQFAANLAGGESAQAGSQVNQITPTGALTYYQTGVGPNGVPTYTAVSQLTPQQQELLNLQQEGMGLSGGAGANMMANEFGQYSQDPNQAIGGQTSGLEGQMMGEWLQGQAPWMQMSHDQMDTQLRNQGIMPGTPAYNQQMMQLQQSQMMGVSQQASMFQPTAFGEAVQQYSLPMQIAQALMGFNQPGNVGAPETGQAPNYEAPNVIQATANAQQAEEQNYQAQMAQQAAMLQGIMGIGSAGIKAAFPGPSDRRLKRDIMPIGEMAGVQVYIWRYKMSDDWHVGPMIDEVPVWMTAHVGGMRMLRGDWHGR